MDAKEKDLESLQKDFEELKTTVNNIDHTIVYIILGLILLLIIYLSL